MRARERADVRPRRLLLRSAEAAVRAKGRGAEEWRWPWMSKPITELRNRGVQDCCIVVCDGLKGLPDAIAATWGDGKPALNAFAITFEGRLNPTGPPATNAMIRYTGNRTLSGTQLGWLRVAVSSSMLA